MLKEVKMVDVIQFDMKMTARIRVEKSDDSLQKAYMVSRIGAVDGMQT